MGVDDAALSQQALSIHRQDIELSFAHQNRGGAATGLGPTDKMASSTSDMTIDDAWESVKSVVLAGWSKTTRRMRTAGAVLIFFILAILLLRPSIPEPSLPRLPSLSLDYGTDDATFHVRRASGLALSFHGLSRISGISQY